MRPLFLKVLSLLIPTIPKFRPLKNDESNDLKIAPLFESNYPYRCSGDENDSFISESDASFPG